MTERLKRPTATDPWIIRGSDGAAIYDLARKDQLPTALDSGALKVREQNPLTSLELGAATLAALETIGLDATTLAALETIELGTATLAALESITADVSDRDARLLGRVKALDSAGAVIDPVLKGQLPTALDSGALKTKEQSPLSQAVTDAQLRAAALEVVGDSFSSSVGHITANGTGQRVQLACAGATGGAIRYYGTYGTGPIPVFEISLDNGVSFQSALATQIQASTPAEIEASATTLSASLDTVWVVTIPPGATHIATYVLFGYSSGTVDVQLVAGAFKSPSSIQARTVGDLAHDAVNNTNVSQVGGHGTTQGSPPTNVNTGDRVRAWFDLHGAQHVIHGATDLQDGRTVVTTAGTRVALAASTPCQKVLIQAESDNTGIVVVGDAATVVAALATRRGIALPIPVGGKPDPPIEIEVDNLADIGLDSTVSGDGVTYVYTT